MRGLPPISLNSVASVVKKHMQSIDRMHDWHRLHPWICFCCQSAIYRGKQLHRKSFEHNQSELPANAPPNTTSKWDVTEAVGFALVSICAEPFWVEELWVLIRFCCLVRVTDAVHDAPALRDLITLQMHNIWIITLDRFLCITFSFWTHVFHQKNICLLVVLFTLYHDHDFIIKHKLFY